MAENMKTKISMLILVVALFFSACNKDEPIVPQGHALQKPSYYTQGGFIKGTVTGHKGTTGDAFTINFNYQYYYKREKNHHLIDSTYDIHLLRFQNPDSPCYNHCGVWIVYDSLSQTGGVELSDFNYEQDLGNNQTFVFSLSPVLVGGTLSNFSYNTSTHIAKGDFAAAIDSTLNSSFRYAYITGSFETIAMQ